MSKLPTIHKINTVAQSQLFRIEALHLEFSNGEKRVYERLAGNRQGGGAVLIVPMLDHDTVLMIKEYSAGLHCYELGLPKGRVEAGEDILHAANREIMEEIGYAAHQLTLLKSVSLAPGYMGHRTNIVLAQELYPATALGDEPEPLEVIPWKLSQLDQLMNNDECSEGRSLLALYMVRDLLKKQPHSK